MMDIEVTQADRDAAWPFCWSDTPPETEALQQAVRDGELDRIRQVQAFARHRVASVAAARPIIMADQWQPIETARRDGVPLLLLIQGQWADGTPFTMQDVGHWHDKCGPGGSWVFRTPPNYFQMLDDEDAATHWQPLPAPPRTAGAKP